MDPLSAGKVAEGFCREMELAILGWLQAYLTLRCPVVVSLFQAGNSIIHPQQRASQGRLRFLRFTKRRKLWGLHKAQGECRVVPQSRWLGGEMERVQFKVEAEKEKNKTLSRESRSFTVILENSLHWREWEKPSQLLLVREKIIFMLQMVSWLVSNVYVLNDWSSMYTKMPTIHKCMKWKNFVLTLLLFTFNLPLPSSFQWRAK